MSVVLLSIFLQLTAALMSLRLIKVTGYQLPWMLIAAATVLQALRRILILTDLADGSLASSEAQTSELIGLIISMLIFMGVASIEPFFTAQAQSIAERKQAEEELKKTVEKLKELDKLKDDFLNLTTHELKTPLIPIKSQAQLLLAGDYGALNKEQSEAMEMILRNEENLNRLSSDVLDIAKIRSNKLNLALEKASLNEAIAEMIKNLKTTAEEKHIDLSFSPAPELPKILIDKTRIEQVVGNLLGNAIKFTPEGGKIKIKIQKKENNIITTVEDTGIGLSQENIEKIFTPFFQVESNLARKYHGTGLGLPICKGIIENHNGKIWADSQGEGKGTSFSFSLPIEK